MLPHNSVNVFGWVFRGKEKWKGKKGIGIARGRGKKRSGRERERERGKGRGLLREARRAKMLLSDTLVFHKSKELSAKRADMDSFPRGLMVLYGISV